MEQNISDLLSEDKEVIRNAAERIKNEGDLKIVPALFDILQQPTITHTTETAVAEILADIRDTSFIKVLQDAIIDSKERPEYQAKLVRVCWESAMDFSDLLPLLCEIAINSDFMAAMEATTAIEEQLRFADHDMLHEMKSLILNSSQQDSPFAEQILNIVQSALDDIHAHEEETCDCNCDCHDH